MGCFFKHNWTKWSQYTKKVTDLETGAIISSEIRQYRECIRCCKYQDEYVSMGFLPPKAEGQED